MVGRRREAVAFAGAVCAHVVAFGVLRWTLDVPAPVSAPAPVQRSLPELAVEVELGAPATDAPPTADAPTAESTPQPKLARLPGGVVRSPGDALGEGAPTAPEEPGDAALELHSENDDAERPIDLGIGPDGWKRWVTPSKPGERPRAEAPRPRKNRFQVFRAPPVSSTGGLQEGLEERDRELGLGPAGRVLSALHRAAHETIAPATGVARFDVKVLRTGVVEVTLKTATDRVDQWNAVAAHVANDLRASPPRIPPPRDGVRLLVELVAEETMPNGMRLKSLKGPHLEAVPPELRDTKSATEQLKRDNPTAEADPSVPPIQLDLPGVYLSQTGKVCSYRLGVNPMGPVFQGGCDLANLGAKPQRMVRTKVLEQSLF